MDLFGELRGLALHEMLKVYLLGFDFTHIIDFYWHLEDLLR